MIGLPMTPPNRGTIRVSGVTGAVQGAGYYAYPKPLRFNMGAWEGDNGGNGQ